MSFTQDELKKQVAYAAIDYVKSGIIGVGTGSTANYFIDALSEIKIKLMVPLLVAKQLQRGLEVME